MSENRFEPGQSRARSPKPSEAKYFHAVFRAAARAGMPIRPVTASRSARRFAGTYIGRGSVAARMLALPDRYAGFRARETIVKVRVVKFGRTGFRNALAHLSYVERGAFGRNGEEGRLYSAREDQADRKAFLEPCREDRHQFRLVISARDAVEYEELRPLVRRFMGRMEEDLGTELDWIAGDHLNTEHPHTHMIIRGKDDRGDDLIMSPYYLARGMRARLSEIISIDLGPITNFEILRAKSLELHADRLTEIDRNLLFDTDKDGIVAAGGRNMFEHTARTGRLRHLESLGLAEDLGRGRWKLDHQVEPILSNLGVRANMIRRLQDALAHAGLARNRNERRIYAPSRSGAISGRLLARGFAEASTEGDYLVIDGTDGRVHYVEVSIDERARLVPDGAIVRITPKVNEAGTRDHDRSEVQAGRLRGDGSAPVGKDPSAASVQADVPLSRYSSNISSSKLVNVELLSVVPLERLADYDGATWLDREIIAQKTSLRASGFGREVRSALDRRKAWLVSHGLAVDNDDESFRYQPNMLKVLERREINRVAKSLAQETGLPFSPSKVGSRIEGTVRRRFELASGPFAMIETGFGFALVPWQPVMELARDRGLSGLVREDGIRWTIGRERGLAL